MTSHTEGGGVTLLVRNLPPIPTTKKKNQETNARINDFWSINGKKKYIFNNIKMCLPELRHSLDLIKYRAKAKRFYTFCALNIDYLLQDVYCSLLCLVFSS